MSGSPKSTTPVERLPGLRGTVRILVQACPGNADDIEAEALAAPFASVARCEPLDRPAPTVGPPRPAP